MGTRTHSLTSEYGSSGRGTGDVHSGLQLAAATLAAAVSYDVNRLLVLDWEATRAALQARGDDFYWLARDSTDDDIDFTRIPFVTEPMKAIAHLRGWRDPEANQVYHRMRTHLIEEDRRTCDACFGRLFWEGGEETAMPRPGAMIADLALPADSPPADIGMALAPAAVGDVLGMLQRLPWQALEAAASAIGDFETKYVPDFSCFKGHVADLEVLLVEAAERRAGVQKVLLPRYNQRRSTVITSNIEWESWGDYLGDHLGATALVDRMVHHSHVIVINGPSYRDWEHKQEVAAARGTDKTKTETAKSVPKPAAPAISGGARRRTK